ncbi:MAG: aminodeoxychorismate lyase [Thiotrichaceae bacterium]|nr:aminodeoxychorismate lyase [Thiotrichaceae bacterium]PCI15025.1 MAG: aminodeoxychorismate lyase [Thiotrichales bacterium]
MMLINGIVTDLLPASDRGLQYGDGLFETIAVVGGEPQLWAAHMARLTTGCDALQLPRVAHELLLREARQLCVKHKKTILKIIITRGSDGRGYRFPENVAATRLLSVHPWPDYPPAHYQHGIAAMVCDTRLASYSALAGIKHLNRLEQVLARNEWRGDDIHEGLMLDHHGNVIEGTMSNLFIIEGDTLITPQLNECGIRGVMRETVLAQAAQLDITTRIETVSLARLKAASACFVTNSIIGLWPLRTLDDITYQPAKVTQELIQDLIRALSERRLITAVIWR